MAAEKKFLMLGNAMDWIVKPYAQMVPLAWRICPQRSLNLCQKSREKKF